jgi:hypothetical protein
MKCWIGKEQEGRKKGAKTLFVRALWVSDMTLYWLKNECLNRKVNRLYFGAGRWPLLFMSKRLRDVFPRDEYELVLECPVWQLRWCNLSKDFTRIVCSLRTRKALRPFILVPKIDTYEMVAMYDAGAPSINSLSSLKRGLYENEDFLIKK